MSDSPAEREFQESKDEAKAQASKREFLKEQITPIQVEHPFEEPSEPSSSPVSTPIGETPLEQLARKVLMQGASDFMAGSGHAWDYSTLLGAIANASAGDLCGCANVLDEWLKGMLAQGYHSGPDETCFFCHNRSTSLHRRWVTKADLLMCFDCYGQFFKGGVDGEIPDGTVVPIPDHAALAMELAGHKTAMASALDRLERRITALSTAVPSIESHMEHEERLNTLGEVLREIKERLLEPFEVIQERLDFVDNSLRSVHKLNLLERLDTIDNALVAVRELFLAERNGFADKYRAFVTEVRDELKELQGKASDTPPPEVPGMYWLRFPGGSKFRTRVQHTRQRDGTVQMVWTNEDLELRTMSQWPREAVWERTGG